MIRMEYMNWLTMIGFTGIVGIIMASWLAFSLAIAAAIKEELDFWNFKRNEPVTIQVTNKKVK